MKNQDGLGWPDNLLAAVLAISPPFDSPPSEPPADFVASVEYVLYSMPDQRDAEILRMRYKKDMSYTEIGETLGISGERVRQIVIKCLRYLRKPAQLRFLEYGVYGVVRKLQVQVWDLETQSSENVPRLDDAPLGALRLRPRTYNCLLRADLKTIADVLKLSAAELLSIRSLGVKALEEIVDALEGQGFNCEHLKNQADTDSAANEDGLHT